MTAELQQSDELLVGFIDESVDALHGLGSDLDDYRQDPANPGPINSVFRAVHSIKGNAGFFGLAAIKKYAHALENTLDEVRNGRIQLNEGLQRAFIESFDLLDEMLQSVLDGEAASELSERHTEILDRIGALSAECRVEENAEQRLLREAAALADEIAAAGFPQSTDWADRLRSLLAVEEESAVDQAAAVTAVDPKSLANVRCVVGDEDVTDRVRSVLDLFLAVAERQYSEEVGRAFLDSAERFAQWAEAAGAGELCQTLRSSAADFKTILESPLDVDATLISIVWDKLAPALDSLRAAQRKTDAPLRNGEQDDDGQEESADERRGGSKGGDQSGAARGKQRLLRVKEEAVDAFLDDVSNLFITCERFKDLQSRMAAEHAMSGLVDELRQINAAFGSQANALQHSVVALRKVPVRNLFSKFPRMARSLAANLQKQLDVHLEGEDLEIDKSLVEDLDAPLTHMIRNVCDHAIETPPERRAKGADETGNLWLKCDITRTQVVITVQDDGRGIDPRKLRSKAVEKGVISQSESDALSEQEAVELIFHPGFSTAETISDVSGRGVGMDVVRTNLREHNGDVAVYSQVGVGTTFRLEIPLRKAVIVVDGLLLQEGEDRFVVPFDCIGEIVDLGPDNLKSIQRTYVATVRGEPVAAASLGRLLGVKQSWRFDGDVVKGVVIHHKEESVCLLVDRVLGQRKVVVNNMDEILPNSGNIAGVAQLDGGTLALVLSTGDIIKNFHAGAGIN